MQQEERQRNDINMHEKDATAMKEQARGERDTSLRHKLFLLKCANDAYEEEK